MCVLASRKITSCTSNLQCSDFLLKIPVCVETGNTHSVFIYLFSMSAWRVIFVWHPTPPLHFTFLQSVQTCRFTVVAYIFLLCGFSAFKISAWSTAYPILTVAMPEVCQPAYFLLHQHKHETNFQCWLLQQLPPSPVPNIIKHVHRITEEADLEESLGSQPGHCPGYYHDLHSLTTCGQSKSTSSVTNFPPTCPWCGHVLDNRSICVNNTTIRGIIIN